jgi:hypothetical protein
VSEQEESETYSMKELANGLRSSRPAICAIEASKHRAIRAAELHVRSQSVHAPPCQTLSASVAKVAVRKRRGK